MSQIQWTDEVWNPTVGCSLVSVRGVTTGCGYRIRAYTVFQRDQDGLFEGPAA